MFIYFVIAAGGALGSVARYWLSGAIGAQVGETFPWGTLFVNVAGSAIIGFIATFTGPEGRYFAPTEARQFLMLGVCGGFTTFSSFSLQTLNLVREGEWLRAGGYIAASVILCLIGVWLGHLLAEILNQPQGS